VGTWGKAEIECVRAERIYLSAHMARQGPMVAHCSNIFVAGIVNGASAMEARAAGASSPIGGPSVLDRKQFGHWEGDTMIGKNHKQGVVIWPRLLRVHASEPLRLIMARSLQDIKR